MRTEDPERRLLVPAYAFPGTEPALWQALAAAGRELTAVILNPHNGPGERPSPEYGAVARRLRAAGAPLLGYVDTGYGRRGHGEVADDIRRHREWYAVDGLFLDQVASAPELLPHYRRLAVTARGFDAETVVLNPGVHPDPGYAEIADLLVTFEGPWSAYRELEVPSWTSAFPAERFAHLVYQVPPGRCAEVGETARLRHAAVHYATPGSRPNPWGVLMPRLLGADGD